MKKTILFLGLTLGAGFFINSCSRDSDTADYERECGVYNGKILYTGPRGGCYYKQTDGEKTYVDRSNCKCLK